MKSFWEHRILFLILEFLIIVYGNKCPPPEEIMPCRCRGRNEQVQVWCSHSDLERVNGALESLMKLRSMPAIDELIVENNRMPTLPARAFGALRIGRLLLRNNGLEDISRNAFAGLEDTLEELYVVEDKLVDFPFDSIENLKNLEAFTLEKSQIRLLPRFNGLNRLKHIRIDGSLISSFPVGAFASMDSVKQIHVVNSKVSSLAEGIFGPLESLVLANFSGNRIHLIQRRSFARLPKLEVLSLSNNNLNDAVSVGKGCEELTSLKSLDVSNNKLKVLPEASFVNLRTLQMLNLASNRIQQVNTRTFTHLPALRKVDLSDNLIRNLPVHFFDSSPLLEELRLRKNLIGTATEIEVLSSLKSLRFLDLGENGLKMLPQNSIKDHMQLQRLDLSDNKITKIQQNAFNNVPSLIEMSLRNNSLQDLAATATAGTGNGASVGSGSGSGSGSGESFEIPSLRELDLSANNLQSLNQEALKGIPRISRLDISYNSLKSIGKGVFSYSRELELLDLTGNGINSFSSDALIGLSRLNKLDLSRNHLDNIQSGTFRHLASLQSLNLANNRINNVPSNLFVDLKSLEELSLKSNLINYIPPVFFGSLENLKELNLKHNSISGIHDKMFTGLKNLEILKLSSNQISRFDDYAFDPLVKLKLVDLNSNRINILNGRLFRNLENLERLEARENRIGVVENGVLENSKKLQLVDLANNAIVNVPELIKANPTLNVIDLSHNQIKEILKDTFKGCKNLVELYLNDNRIKQIPANTFEGLDALTILDLDGNEILEILPGTFKSLPRLIYLRLSRNKIRTIRNTAFSDLNSLDGLDLQENDLETIGEEAFDKTGALKYLNLSHNNFDSVTRMGLFHLNSLEVLDMGFNRIRQMDSKALKHLQWLVELRINDNGICRLPVGIFDGMSRLKMLVMRNNYLAHLYETVFYKLKNNIAFLDISGNPLSCDCELTWLRNLVISEQVQELLDSTCDTPRDLRGHQIKHLRPNQMQCEKNAIRRGTPPRKYEEEPCPILPNSKRKPRPPRIDSERPFFGTNPINNNDFKPGDGDSNVIRKKKKKDEKASDSDFTMGDSTTIYQSTGTSTSASASSSSSTDARKSQGFGALGTLFGFPLPSLDFSLNLDNVPNLSSAQDNNNSSTQNPNSIKLEETDRLFNSNANSKQQLQQQQQQKPAPLPSSWIERPSSASIYQPLEYIPRKPSQPYIPLNHFSFSSSNVNVALPSQQSQSDLNRTPVTPPVQSWHPAHPTGETGFIPIQPYFHPGSSKNKSAVDPNSLDLLSSSPSAINIQSHNQNQNQNKNNNKNPTNNDFSLSDIWGMFSDQGNMTNINNNKNDNSHKDKDRIPLNFSDPIDTAIPSTVHTPIVSTNPFPEPLDLYPRRILGQPTITKITMDDVNSEPFPIQNSQNTHSNYNYNYPVSSTTNEYRIPNKISETDNDNDSYSGNGKKEPSQPQQLIPPVSIGNPEEPLDWYYTNYNNNQQNHRDLLNKFKERHENNDSVISSVNVSSSAFTSFLKTYTFLSVSCVIFHIVNLRIYM